MENKLIQKYADNTYLRAIVQLIPNFGGAIDTILYEKGSKWRQERLEKLLKSFDDQLSELTSENEILRENINRKIDTEEFYNLFIHCAQEVVIENDKDKIINFSNILVNYLTFEKEKSYEVELFFNITKELNPFEISILSGLLVKDIHLYKSYHNHICDLEKYQREYRSSGMRISTGYEESIPEQYFVDGDKLFALNRLERNFLITINRINTSGTLPVTYSSGSMTTSTQIPYLESIEYSITDFGKKYCDWIKSST